MKIKNHISQNYLKIMLSFLVILLLFAVVRFFVINRETDKSDDIRSNSLIIKNSRDILINDSLNRDMNLDLIKAYKFSQHNDSIIIDLLKTHIKQHGN